jgi:hypothetical protein
MAVPRLCRGIGHPVIIDMLVLASEKTVIAIMAFGYINDHIPFFHGSKPPY